MIKLTGISKTFGKGSPNELKLFKDFNLEIHQYDFVVVIGGNGSGKTSLLNIIAGTIRHDSGSIYLDDDEVSDKKDFERSKWISRIFQNPLAGTAPELSILQNFRLAAIRTKSKGLKIGTDTKFKNEVRERIQLLNLGLENKLDLEMGNLSGGQRQALTLLMSTMDKTKLLLLDEPTAALDPVTSEVILNLIDKVIREYKLTALLVTHQIKDVLTYGNRIIQMKGGQVIKDLNRHDLHELNMKTVYEWFS
jgi:putative ABC transport system ATP-binding protein